MISHQEKKSNVVSEWCDNQKKPSGNFRQLLQERIEKPIPRRKLTSQFRTIFNLLILLHKMADSARGDCQKLG